MGNSDYCSSEESPEILMVDELESDITDLPSCCSNCSRATFATPPPFLATVTFSQYVAGLISLDSSVVAASANVFRAKLYISHIISKVLLCQSFEGFITAC